MKKFIKGTLLDTESGQENSYVGVWQKPITKESPLTLRNTGRIEQLESVQADLRKKLTQVYKILNSLWGSRLASTKSLFYATHLPWEDVAQFDEDVSVWEPAQLYIQSLGTTIEQIAPVFYDKLSTVTKLFGELEEDFEDIARRITRCAVLEKELAAFENSLDDEKTEYLAWCVSLIRDVLDYNYAEDLTQTHLNLLKKAIGLIYNKGPEFNKEDYQNLHKEFLQAGLALIPTTQKAIDRYGA